MLVRNERGVVHIFGFFILFIALGAIWVFMGWQQHLDFVHAQIEMTRVKVDALEVRIKAVEAKLNM